MRRESLFKLISNKNFTEPDVSRFFPNFTQQSWIDFHLRPRLNPTVPEEIILLYETVRGSMIYGWFFYPLLTLASEQCYRILEVAAHKKCEQLNIPTERILKSGKHRTRDFSELIQELKTYGAINIGDSHKWDAGRSLRNTTSHPQQRMILVPGQTLSILTITVNLINNLFEK